MKDENKKKGSKLYLEYCKIIRENSIVSRVGKKNKIDGKLNFDSCVWNIKKDAFAHMCVLTKRSREREYIIII